METTTETPPAAVVDVSGLTPAGVRLIELHIAALRATGGGPTPQFISEPPRMTVEEHDRWLKELTSGPSSPPLPADWSRADIYDDHD